ncbi:STAS domain-containing protein [Actinosynnema sp. NPDC023658]|uniref:STAS domain-containing protein n=1 Tax=Actinosynnema sp. NPDC023658 TaxID=3155465 RepID=UPI0033F1F79C
MNSADSPATGLSTEEHGTTVVVRVTGEIDMSNSDALLDRCVEVLDAEAGALVIDLSGVTFFASSGIAALGHVRSHNASLGGRPVHVVVGRPVRRALELVAMDKLLPLHDTREDALAAVGEDTA